MGRYSDSNPVAGASAASGMKLNDGREKGEQMPANPSLDAKETFSPNDDAPQLPQRDGLED